MPIGEKIKRLRLSKVLTQKQLCGDVITRNMLSQIENGKARPSLETVTFLAKRLNVPASYLISDEKDEPFYSKYFVIDNIKRAFSAGDYGICRDLCLNTEYPDDELNFLISMCDVKLAKADFFYGRLRSSVRNFAEAVEYDSRTIYSRPSVKSDARVYFGYYRTISPTLLLDVPETEFKTGISEDDPVRNYILALEAIKQNTSCLGSVLSYFGISDDSLYGLHLHAKDRIYSEKYADAIPLLDAMLKGEERIANPILYNVYSDLELCSGKNGDKETAYAYSADKMNLLEKMLRDAT